MDYRDIILGTIGTVLTVLAGWLAPAIQRSISSLPSMFEAQKEIAIALTVLSKVCQTMQLENQRYRSVVLLIEDSNFDAHQFQVACWDILHKHNATMVIAPTMESCYRHVPFSRVIVIDVNLPDATQAHVAQFVKEMSASTPVIIWAADEHKPADFPGAFAVLCKTEPIDKISALVNDALSEPRRV